MNWITANMELDGNHAQIRSTDMNELLVRGGKCSYKSAKQSTSAILIAIVFFLSLFHHLPLGSLLSFILYLSLHLYPTRGQLMVYTDTCPISLL